MSTSRTYEVPDISCGHCKDAIEDTVGGLDDVTRVSVDIDAKRVTVDGTASDQAVRDAIEDAGYEVAAG